MTYYINPMWFYLMSVSTGLKTFLCILGTISLIICAIAFISLIIDSYYISTDLEDDKKIVKIFKKIMIAGVISILIGTLVPSKEACIEMMIASQVTHENVTATKEEIYEIIDYVTDKVKEKE